MDDLTNKVFGELVVIQRDKDVITKEGYHIPTCDLSGEYGIGYTSNKGEMFYFDLDDYDKIKNYCWYSVRGKYLYGKIEDSHKTISMHKLLGFAGYDHIDRNGFNNRKSNLRSCSQKENTRNRSIPSNNTSGIIGVRLHKKTSKRQAYISVGGKQKNLPLEKDCLPRINTLKNLLHKNIYMLSLGLRRVIDGASYI